MGQIIETKSKGKLPKTLRVSAIAWAAKKENTSYGKLILVLNDKQKRTIYHEYHKYLIAKEQASLLLAEQQRRKKATRVKIRKPRQTKKMKSMEQTETH